MARRFRTWRVLLLALLALALPGAAYVVSLDHRVRVEFDNRRFAQPARIYARALELHSGLHIASADVVNELRETGYREGVREGESGWFAADGSDGLQIATRPFVFWDGAQPAARIRIVFDGGVVAAVRDDHGKELAVARLEPVPIGGIYPSNNEDRLLVKLEQVPRPLLQALIATEDRRFYSHHGFDLRGIARAAASWVRGKPLEGGSTLTQQLVKNFFLTPERTLRRKCIELVMAMLLELHFDKDQILETYLNEVYLGQDRDRAIRGIGIAAQRYFGKPVEQLTLPEDALLVGLIKGPALYDPYRHPDRALERRNLVLREATEQGFIPADQYAAARAAPLGVSAGPSYGTSQYPAFVALVHRQLKQEYDEADLQSDGLRIFTTLDPHVQDVAEGALERKLDQFDRDKRFGSTGLQGAVVVVDSRTGEVQAVVGGRDVHFPGFNRALDAARPVGSLLKPGIYLTALADPSRYTLVTPIDDGPFVWKTRGAPDWRPVNDDRKYHGMVQLRTALAQSYNVATARLGTQLGVERVLATLRQLGVQRELKPYAATLLGATELSPLEIAQMYQTIASGGLRAPLRAIRDVTTQDGRPLKRYALTAEQAFPAEPIYLIASAMQGVVREGTARTLANWIRPELAVAGKTGTTDDQRDAWFAGFTGDRVAVVWVGYDDNRPARLYGATAALPIWGEIMGTLDPQRLSLPRPETIEDVLIDARSGLRGDAGCPETLTLPFVHGSAPVELADCASRVGVAVEEIKRRVKSLWERLFGR